MKSAHDLVAEAKQSIKEISVAEADAHIVNADVLIDVREPDEFRQGHLPGAINIPRGMLEFSVSSNPDYEARDTNILLYCKTSGRGALAAKSLGDMGYLHVTSIDGGYDAWVNAGKPVVQPKSIDFE